MQDSIQQKFQNAGFVRVTDGRVLGGVAAGLGRHYGIAPWRARLLFVLVLMVIPGSQLLVYPILWMLMPDERDAQSPAAPFTPMQNAGGACHPL
jgi:phage shock protein C